MDWKREVAADKNQVAATLERIDALVRKLQVEALQVSIAGKVDTQKTRESLLATSLALIKESVKFGENEEAAKNARARIEAMRLANQASRTAEAILRGYDSRDIGALVEELISANEQLKAELTELKRAAGSEKART